MPCCSRRLTAGCPSYRSDWEALRKVLTNLVGNAVKFAREGGRVNVLVTPGEAGGEVLLVVQDDGEGIPPEDLGRIFERFTQVTSDGSRRSSGSGLGLYLSRALVESLGGSIAVESTVGAGGRFTVHIPADGGKGEGGIS